MTAVTFRPRISIFAGPAVVGTLIAYFMLSWNVEEGLLAQYPFGFAFLLGILIFIFGLLTKYRTSGLRLDENSLCDLGRKQRIPWTQVKNISVEIQNLKSVLLRQALVEGPEGTIEFGDYGPRTPENASNNIETAGLALAVIASRTGAEALFPPRWKNALQTPETAVADDKAEVTAKATWRMKLTRSIGMLAFLFKLVPKFFATLIKLLKTVKPGAALLTVGVYSLIFTWQFALALVLMILWHECGHVYAMWRSGLSVKGIYFIPFVGGAAVGQGVANSLFRSAYIAINGPVWGTGLALLCWTAFELSGREFPFLAALVGWGALINIFNLLPIYPLDGGRILSSLAHSLGNRIGMPVVFVSLVAGAAVSYMTGLELLMLMALLGLMEFGSQLATLPFRPTLALLDKNHRLGAAEHEHFTGLVTPIIKGRNLPEHVRQRQETFEHRKKESRQEPMNARQALLVLLGYGALFGILLALLFWADGVPGGGNPLAFLR